MRSTSGFRSLPSACHCSGGSSQIRRTIDSGNPDAVKQLLRELIDRVEITPDRHAYPYFWVPAGCGTLPASGKPGPDAPPVSAHQGDTGWLFVTSGGPALSLFELGGTAGPAARDPAERSILSNPLTKSWVLPALVIRPG